MRMSFDEFRDRCIVRKIKSRKAFDAPYLLIMGYDNGIPFTRYQILPASMCGHRVNLVNHYVRFQKHTTGEYWSGYFHCIHCGLMGTTETMRSYNCDSQRKA